jgi:cold shock CspA family protein
VSTGVVKFWNPEGWGIITPHGVKRGDREREVFVHISRLEGASMLLEGQEVEFSLNPDFQPAPGDGPRALNAKLLGKSAYVPINQGRKANGTHGD